MLPARRDRLVAGGLALVALALYLATLAPGLAFQGGDGHELTVTAATLGLAHPTGYPLFTWLGFAFVHLLPIGEVAYRTNLMSAVLGAGAVGLLYLIGRRLELHPIAAALGAAIYAVSPTFWSETVITEVYAPNAFMVTLTLWFLLRWADAPHGAVGPFVQFAFVYGLSLGTHLSNLGFAPAYTLFVIASDPSILRRPRTIVLAFLAFAFAAAQFVWLPLRADTYDLFPNGPPDTLARFYAYSLGAFANQRFAFPLAALPERMSMYGGLLVEDFGPLGVGLAALGTISALRRSPRRFWLLSGMYVVHVGFFTQLFVTDPDVFFVASHLLVALFVGFGVDAVRVAGGWVPHPRLRFGSAVAALAIAAALLTARAQASLRMNDRSGDTVVGDFTESIFAVLPPGSVLLADRGAFGASFTYRRRLEGIRPDVVMPSELDGRTPRRGAPLYSTRPGPTVGGPPRGALPPAAVYTPVLRTERQELALYRVDAGPPPIPWDPPVRFERHLGALTLVGAEVLSTHSTEPRRVHLRTAWRGGPGAGGVVATRVDDRPIETHLLPKVDDGEVVEDVELVLPSGLGPGAHSIDVGAIELTATSIRPHWTTVGRIEVE
jgi:hypothetical protein